jgi:hypothetical protein
MAISYRSWAAIIFAATIAALPLAVRADPLSLRGGSYDITSRLELPHLERWGIDKVTRICLPDKGGAGAIPVPVLSANNPFAQCSAENFASDGATLEYDIVCPGRGSARAHATYRLVPDAFVGYVAMVMGAKNMTMTEIQHARRVGDCEPAKVGSAARF